MYPTVANNTCMHVGDIKDTVQGEPASLLIESAVS